MNDNQKYEGPIKISEGIYWVGTSDPEYKIRCNPFLIIDEDQAVILDAGNRSDFPTVMMRIMQSGVAPSRITKLIYHHYDPDLCGSMQNVLGLCDNPNIKILSTKDNITYISFYLHKSSYHYLNTIEAADFVLTMNNHTLRFILTPHAHSPGSFVTYEEKSKVLFSSDLFGSFLNTNELFLEIDPECHECLDYSTCQLQYKSCPIKEILLFHRKMMPCGASLAYAMRQIDKLDIQCIAPQHGSILNRKKDIDFLIKKLSRLDNVGIDGLEESIE